MKRSAQNRNRAFTLIELLVVIAIISILAAILFPVFATAREKARQSSCASNLKQIGLSLNQYIQDYDETFPMRRYYTGTTWLYWLDELQPYVKSYALYVCPDHAVSQTWQTTSTHDKVSYTLNNFYQTDPVRGQVWDGANNISSVQAVTDTVFLSEFGFSPSGDLAVPEEFQQALAATYGPAVDLTVSPPRFCSTRSCFIGIHSGGMEVSFLDGHVKWMTPTTLAMKDSTNTYYRYLSKNDD